YRIAANAVCPCAPPPAGLPCTHNWSAPTFGGGGGSAGSLVELASHHHPFAVNVVPAPSALAVPDDESSRSAIAISPRPRPRATLRRVRIVIPRPFATRRAGLAVEP